MTILKSADRVRNWLGSMFDAKAETELSVSRRTFLTGAAAAVACGAIGVAALPSEANAQGIEFYFGGGHSRRRSYDRPRHDRRRSYFDSHSRRRSQNSHSRRRSRDHGRSRSRREYRGWNDNCVPTPFGWFCY